MHPRLPDPDPAVLLPAAPREQMLDAFQLPGLEPVVSACPVAPGLGFGAPRLFGAPQFRLGDPGFSGLRRLGFAFPLFLEVVTLLPLVL
jgi:hypothetical protein